MKKILFILLISVFITGCFSNTEKNIASDNSMQDEMSDLIQNTPIPSDNSSSIEQIDEDTILVYLINNSELMKEIDKNYKYHPTYITILNNYENIAWGYEGEIVNPSDEDLEVLKSSGLGSWEYGKYIHYGTLTKIKENIFSVKGSYLPSAESLGGPISADIDYYLVFDNNNLYIILDKMSLEEINEHIKSQENISGTLNEIYKKAQN